MTLIKTIKVILFKELLEVVRDRRSLTSAILLSVLMPVFMLAGYYFAAQEEKKAQTAEIRISGAQNAPSLISFLASKGLTQGDESELELIIPEDYRNKLSSGYRATVTIRGDMSSNNTVTARLFGNIQLFASQIAGSRLVARGVSPVVMNPINVNKQDTGEASSIARFVAPLFVFMLLMTPIYSVMPACIDCTAGERERHGLYPLLLQPIAPISIPIGKWLMLITVGMSGLLLAICSGFVAYDNIEFNGMTLGLNLTVVSAALFLLVALPTIALLSAMMMGVATFAKTFKEGQTYVGLATIFPVFIAGVGSIADDKYQAFLPLWAEATLLGNVLSGTETHWLPWLFTVFCYGLLISAFLFWMSRSIQRQALESSN